MILVHGQQEEHGSLAQPALKPLVFFACYCALLATLQQHLLMGPVPSAHLLDARQQHPQ